MARDFEETDLEISKTREKSIFNLVSNGNLLTVATVSDSGICNIYEIGTEGEEILILPKDELVIFCKISATLFADTRQECGCSHFKGRKVDTLFGEVVDAEYVLCLGHRMNYRQVLKLIALQDKREQENMREDGIDI